MREQFLQNLCSRDIDSCAATHQGGSHFHSEWVKAKAIRLVTTHRCLQNINTAVHTHTHTHTLGDTVASSTASGAYSEAIPLLRTDKSSTHSSSITSSHLPSGSSLSAQRVCVCVCVHVRVCVCMHPGIFTA
jgi:hypothetical protein